MKQPSRKRYFLSLSLSSSLAPRKRAATVIGRGADHEHENE
jgi:hypothetical protein